ncbi:MAG: hypothetical protein P8Y65_03465 [Campylobacterales bacterium]|jgi:hypothetical protein
MKETLIRLEHRFEDALLAYLASEGSEDERSEYRRLLEAFEALKSFETEAYPILLTA